MYRPYKIHLILYLFFIVFAFFCNSPKEILSGFKEIIFSKDLLITDYIELANMGSAMFNVGIVGVICIMILFFGKIKPNGSLIMAVWLTTGFSFFGKNVFNIWPVMAGVYLYSLVKKAPFSNFSLICLLSTALAPIVSQTSFIGISSYSSIQIFFGICLGVLAGFILPPISAATVKVHAGYDLYNVGFSAGLIGTVYASFARSFGIVIEKNLIWGTTYNKELTIFVFVISFYLIFVGILCKGTANFVLLKEIFKHSGRLVTDYYFMYEEAAYINMGILGIFSCLVLHLIGADINGPTLGGIFTIMGFGAFGKHIFNITPILIGSIASAYLNISHNITESNTLAILFSTCLAPIAGQFGIIWGIVAGFLHVSIVGSIGDLHSGLNLYSNGYAGGFVALILIPIITSFGKYNKE